MTAKIKPPPPPPPRCGRPSGGNDVPGIVLGVFFILISCWATMRLFG